MGKRSKEKENNILPHIEKYSWDKIEFLVTIASFEQFTKITLILHYLLHLKKKNILNICTNQNTILVDQ